MPRLNWKIARDRPAKAAVVKALTRDLHPPSIRVGHAAKCKGFLAYVQGGLLVSLAAFKRVHEDHVTGLRFGVDILDSGKPFFPVPPPRLQNERTTAIDTTVWAIRMTRAAFVQAIKHLRVVFVAMVPPSIRVSRWYKSNWHCGSGLQRPLGR